MMTPYKNLRHSAVSSFPNPDEAAASDALAGSFSRRLQRYVRVHRARRRVHRLLTWIFGHRYRHGTRRFVALVGPLAYKVPRFDSGLTIFLMGWLSNREEANRWRQATTLYIKRSPLEPHPSTRLAPVRRSWLCGLLVVMARCEDVPEAEAEAYIDAERRQELEEPELAFNWDYWCQDLHATNLGRYEGRIVCLDYSN